MLVVPSLRPREFPKGQASNSLFHNREIVKQVATGTVLGSRESDTPCIGSNYNVEPCSSLQIDSPKVVCESHAEPISIRAAIVYQRNARFIKVTLWRGPLFVRHWHQSRQSAFGPLPRNQGYGVGISFAFPSSQFTNATFTTSFLRKFNKSWMSTSVHWNLSLPAVISKDSEIMEFASLGNLEAMVRLFQSGRANPTDVAPDGDSLLHVRLSGYLRNLCSDLLTHLQIAVRHNHLGICRWLLQEGADVNASDEDGE
jgi:hypothetical protein